MTERTAFSDVALHLHPDDNVAIARRDLPPGLRVDELPGVNGSATAGGSLVLEHAIEAGHRFALAPVDAGEFLRQYGEPIGTSRGILPGQRVDHDHMSDEVPRVRDLPADLANPAPEPAPDADQVRFPGFHRADGRVGTRNWVLVVPSSMCASHEAQQIATLAEFQAWSREDYPNVDGVTSVPHQTGCGTPDGENIQTILRVLSAYATHPNVGAVLFLELGCEKTGQDMLRAHLRERGLLSEDGRTLADRPARWIGIQESGGTRKAVARGLEVVQELLPLANRTARADAPISALTLGVECGGSDSFSGISANPALGHASDLLVRHGGTVILSEVPEFCGAEHLLARRARDRQVAEEVFALVDWYRERAAHLGKQLGENPSPGNIRGGLLNITLKSLGAIAKGGTTPVQGTMDYGMPPPRPGLNLMQGPGYDQESVPGLVASGATAVVFTTGRGTTIGNAICPVIKLATNTPIFERMQGDLDLDAGGILDGRETVEDVGRRVFAHLAKLAAGEVLACAEETGHREFSIWKPDPLSL